MRKLALTTYLTILLLLLSVFTPFEQVAADGTGAQFSFNPSSGFVIEGDQFIVDILIDTNGEEVVKGRAVITFDPTLAKIVKAERNNSLFAQFPENDQSTDNVNGVLMLGGFTQSGSSNLYKTTGAADVFARVTFEALKPGALKLDWEFTGSDLPFKSVVIADGSPPQNILQEPQPATFTIQDDGSGSSTSGDTTGGSTTGGNTTGGNTGTVPNTAVFDSKWIYVGAAAMFGALFIFSGGSILYRVSEFRLKKYRTIVDY